MDKSWVSSPRTSSIYQNGLEVFIEFSLKYAATDGKMYCPCKFCLNRYVIDPKSVREHLTCDGFMDGYGYQTWIFHGEKQYVENHNLGDRSNLESIINNRSQEEYENCASSYANNFSELNERCHDDFNMEDIANLERENIQSSNCDDDHQSTDAFRDMLGEDDEPLFPGCTNFTTMMFVLRIYHIKVLAGGSTSKLITLMLDLIKEAFPQCATLPSSYSDAKKIVKRLNLGYEKIHACPNDCTLYWGDSKLEDSCRTCGTSRWESTKEGNNDDPFVDEQTATRPKKPAKVLRYFPLIPRLKRLFGSSRTASSMRWHDTGRTKDGLLRHPADAKAWKDFDERYPDFASDPRNVRLGLASDGFNPFRTMSTTYSTWPVVLVPYNMEPWVCMKKASLILSMVIPGEKGPGNDIDVYLQPLIDELKQLWEGVDVFDASIGQNFNLRACLLWTINDFPAYANLSGWSTKGRIACPICMTSTNSRWLKHGKKFCYLGNRRWLDNNHEFRFQADQFDNTIELSTPPIPPSGVDVLSQVEGTNFTYGKVKKTSKRKKRISTSTSIRGGLEEEDADVLAGLELGDLVEDQDNIDEMEYANEAEDTIAHGHVQVWKKMSIFFELPYWKYNLLRHNLDVMHIEKNVFDNLIGTLLNLDKKSKDNIQARRDLEDMGIRPELHPFKDRPNDFPAACYTLSSKEKDMFLHVLKNMKVPDGYSSNIARCVNLRDRKLMNLKSHDGHIMMQDILPISLRGVASKTLISIISELSSFFKKLCSKVLDPNQLDQLQAEIALTLCKMEKLFPPGFFTIMVHLIIHLPMEAKLGGPVHYRWMYFMERFLVELKSLVRNRARPEGSIAEGYIALENVTFCSVHIPAIEAGMCRPQRNYEQPRDDNHLFSSGGRALGTIRTEILDGKSLDQAHRYVLVHSDKLNNYRREFLNSMRTTHRVQSTQLLENKWLIEKFPGWLLRQVPKMIAQKVSPEIVALARGPNEVIQCFDGFIINGFRFHTKSREAMRKTQNSGVMVEVDGRNYYGILKQIIELNYYGVFKVILFRCDWVDVNSPRGLKMDDNGFTLVNFSKLIHTGISLKDDPYIFSSQARQVFYVDDPRSKGWQHVVMTKPRDVYDMGGSLQAEVDDEETYTQCLAPSVNLCGDLDDYTSLLRVDDE